MRKFDHGLTHVRHDILYWLDVPVPKRVTFKLCTTAYGLLLALYESSADAKRTKTKSFFSLIIIFTKLLVYINCVICGVHENIA